MKLPEHNYPMSRYFKFYEMVRSNTAARLGIDNTEGLTDLHIDRLKLLACKVLDPIREQYGAYSPNSVYRCERLEKAICWGGNDKTSSFARWCAKHKVPVNEDSWKDYFSRKSHPEGTAADIEISTVDNRMLWAKIPSIIPVYDQLILEFYKENNPNSGWVHVSFSAGMNRMQQFTIG